MPKDPLSLSWLTFAKVALPKGVEEMPTTELSRSIQERLIPLSEQGLTTVLRHLINAVDTISKVRQLLSLLRREDTTWSLHDTPTTVEPNTDSHEGRERFSKSTRQKKPPFAMLCC
jgi:hypothetical protein